MKVKELLKKIEVANEINKLSNNNEIRLVLDVDYMIYDFKDYKNYLKFFKDTYIYEIVEIMKNVEVELNTRQETKYTDRFGYMREFNFEFTLEQERNF